MPPISFFKDPLSLFSVRKSFSRYGYRKDPNNPKHWVADDEAARIVKEIYSMSSDGIGTEQIAAQLEQDGILTPSAYWQTKGIGRSGKSKQQPPTKWYSSTRLMVCGSKS